jgi:hypothetical protein
MQRKGRGYSEVVVMPPTLNIVERAIWLRTWLALRAFRVGSPSVVRRAGLAAPHPVAGASRP